MKIKRKGFTLIELLAALAVMGIIITISFYSYTSYKKKSDEKILRIEVEQIKVAASAYVHELENDDNYKFYNTVDRVTGEEIEMSCISIRRLQEMGYYKGDLKFSESNQDYNSAVVKVTKKNGVLSYEVITKYDAVVDMNNDRSCYYDKFSSGDVDDVKVSVDNKDEESQLKLSTNIKPSQDKESTYVLRLQLLDADIFTKMTNGGTIYPDLYVSMVIDDSGSMSGTAFNNAKNAAYDMAKQLNEKFGSAAYMQLVRFSDDAEILRYFSPADFSDVVFNPIYGGTNLGNGLTLAYNEIKDKVSDHKYIISLTDGVSDTSISYEYGYSCGATLESCLETVRDNTNSIIIGYNFTNTTYKELADTFYDNVADVDSIFGAITEQIKQEVKPQSIGKARVVAEFVNSSNIIIYDKNGLKQTGFEYEINFKNGVSEADVKNSIYESEFTIDGKELLKNCELKDGSYGSCRNTFDIIKDYYVELYGMDDNVLLDDSGKPVRLYFKNLPQVTIMKELDSYIN